MIGCPPGRGDQDNQSHDGGHPELSTGHGKVTKPDWGWGATVELKKKPASKAGDSDMYEVAVLVMCKPEDKARGRGQGQQTVAPTPMVSCTSVGAGFCCILCGGSVLAPSVSYCRSSFSKIHPKRYFKGRPCAAS